MDLSIAPEIAQLAQRRPARDRSADPAGHAIPRGTLGDHADDLTTLAAAPDRWPDRVRFDPAAPVRIPLGPATWLFVIPPGHVVECDCQLATLIAGEAAENGRPLRHGRTLVHAGRHLVRSGDAGYAVSLHTSVTSKG
jgi:hypothetical protein